MRGSGEERPGEPDRDSSTPWPAGSDPAAKAPVRIGRLKKRAEFLQAARGRRAHSRSFSLQVCKPKVPSGGGVPVARFGLTVTKKVGGAVERNRIKRRLRAVLRSPDLVPDSGHDYVIVARRDALTIPFFRLIAELSGALRQSGRRPPVLQAARNKPDRRLRDATEPIPPH